MLQRTLSDYGAPFRDALPVEDPQTQVSSDQFNRLTLDVAEMTRTTWRAIVVFQPSASADPTLFVASSMWGNTTAYEPVVRRMRSGIYVAAYPNAFTDELGQTEPVSFQFALASIDGLTPGFVRASVTHGNAANVFLFDGTWALADLPAVTVTLWLR